MVKKFDIYLGAESYSTRNSWGHKATLFVNGKAYCKAKIRYYNRTWEEYQYRSVKQLCVERALKQARRDKNEALVSKLEKIYEKL